MPVVEQSKQNTPCFSGDVMTGLAGWKKPRERVLFILCGAGPRGLGRHLVLKSTSTSLQISRFSRSVRRLVTARSKSD